MDAFYLDFVVSQHNLLKLLKTFRVAFSFHSYRWLVLVYHNKNNIQGCNMWQNVHNFTFTKHCSFFFVTFVQFPITQRVAERIYRDDVSKSHNPNHNVFFRFWKLQYQVCFPANILMFTQVCIYRSWGLARSARCFLLSAGILWGEKMAHWKGNYNTFTKPGMTNVTQKEIYISYSSGGSFGGCHEWGPHISWNITYSYYMLNKSWSISVPEKLLDFVITFGGGGQRYIQEFNKTLTFKWLGMLSTHWSLENLFQASLAGPC